MKASVVDLRYKMKDILLALKRKESVTILSHGKVKGTIIPVRSEVSKKEMKKHSFFGMYNDNTQDVESVMQDLRGGRYDSL